MPKYQETEIPDEAKALFASAEAGEMTPKVFLPALEKIGITGIRAMLLISKVFDLPLETAKTLMVEYEYGSTEAWADNILANTDLNS